MLDLREKDKQIICDVASQCFDKNTDIWAYGSRVKGNNHDASDLDLVIKTSPKNELLSEQLIRFKQLLQESDLPVVVQVLDWNMIPKHFQENILLGYEVLVSI
jgi:predicted nucleotidyltransferase